MLPRLPDSAQETNLLMEHNWIWHVQLLEYASTVKGIPFFTSSQAGKQN